jgi:hypothetical protein
MSKPVPSCGAPAINNWHAIQARHTRRLPRAPCAHCSPDLHCVSTSIIRKPRNVDTMGDEDVVVLSYEDKKKFCSVIAKPLAEEKLAKKILKVAKKAAKKKQIKRGVKEVIKALRKKQKGCEPRTSHHASQHP